MSERLVTPLDSVLLVLDLVAEITHLVAMAFFVGALGLQCLVFLIFQFSLELLRFGLFDFQLGLSFSQADSRNRWALHARMQHERLSHHGVEREHCVVHGIGVITECVGLGSWSSFVKIRFLW